MKTITPLELKSWQESGEKFTLIDVRESYEASICQIGGHLIPMGEISSRLNEIPKTGNVVLHCRSGKRAEAVIDMLERMHGYTNLINLEGGILAYAELVDPLLETY